MKNLKTIVLIILLVVSAQNLMGKNLTADDLSEPKLKVEDINKMNKTYSMVLQDCGYKCKSAVLMNIVKAKILYPDCDYECLLKPIQKIMKKSKDNQLKMLATTTDAILKSDVIVHINKENLYNIDVNKFFAYVHQQFPKNYVAAMKK